MRHFLIIFITLIVIQPFFWKNYVQYLPKSLVEYSKTPSYVVSHVTDLFTGSNLTPVNEMRWNSRNSGQKLIGYLFYNPLIQIVRELVNGLGNLAPQRIFFGDNQICWFLIPAIVLGFIKIFQTKPRLIIMFMFSPIMTIITGQPSALFLLPTLLFYLFFAAIWFQKQPLKILVPYFLLIISFLAFNV